MVLVTTVRHPADTLISLYHYIQNFAGKTTIDPQTLELLGSNGVTHTCGSGSESLAGLVSYVRAKFFKTLHFSIAWLQRGLSYGVRYEDLWHRPVETFKALTDQILPVPTERLTKSIEKSRLEQMRKHAGEDALFFRGGGVESWKGTLPSPIVQILCELPPYPAQCRWLGYSLPPNDAVPETTRENISHVPPLSSSLSFFPLDRTCKRPRKLWKRKGDAGQAFYPWLNAASDKDPYAGQLAPVITNLGAYFYRRRADLREAFPSLYERDRIAFSHWFTEVCLAGPSVLDPYFVVPVYQSWLTGKQPCFAPVHCPGRGQSASAT